MIEQNKNMKVPKRKLTNCKKEIIELAKNKLAFDLEKEQMTICRVSKKEQTPIVKISSFRQ